MIHPKILELANHFGVSFADRNAVDDHVFDGQTIAIRGDWPDKGVPCLFLEDEECRSAPRIFSNHDLMHEVAHYAVAAPEQRDLPEYGLEAVSVAGESYVPNVVDDHEAQLHGHYSEANTQEIMAQFLCILWGRAYDIEVSFSNQKDNIFASWDAYLVFKLKEIDNSLEGWSALIRLDQLGWLDNLPIPIWPML